MTYLEPANSVTCILANSTSLASWAPTATMILATLVLGLILAASFNRRERQLRVLTSQVQSDLEEAKVVRAQLEETRTMVSNLMVTAQRLSARLDERVAALDLASLRMSATRNALPRAQSHATPSRTPAAPVATCDVELSPVLTSIEHAMAPPRSEGPSAVGFMSKSALPARASIEAKTESDEFAGRIYALADAGHGVVEIARDLDEHVGKVELVLALRR